MLLLVTAMGFAAAAFGSRFRFYTLATIAVLAFAAWSATEARQVEAGLPTPWLGVKERVFWYTYQSWFLVLALTLLRRRPGEREPR